MYPSCFAFVFLCDTYVRVLQQVLRHLLVRIDTMHQVYNMTYVVCTRIAVLCYCYLCFLVCCVNDFMSLRAEEVVACCLSANHAHVMPVSYTWYTKRSYIVILLESTVQRTWKCSKALWFRTPEVRFFLYQVPGIQSVPKYEPDLK